MKVSYLSPLWCYIYTFSYPYSVIIYWRQQLFGLPDRQVLFNLNFLDNNFIQYHTKFEIINIFSIKYQIDSGTLLEKYRKGCSNIHKPPSVCLQWHLVDACILNYALTRGRFKPPASIWLLRPRKGGSPAPGSLKHQFLLAESDLYWIFNMNFFLPLPSFLNHIA